MGGKTSSVVKDRYNKKVYEMISIRVHKGYRDRIKQAADERGISVAQLICDSLDNKITMPGVSVDIKDLDAYSRSAHMTPEEYVKQAVREKMEKQDKEFMDDITAEEI